MSGRNPYDEERFVRNREAVDNPTTEVDTGAVARRRMRAYEDGDDREHVVREDARTAYRDPEYDDYEADAVREDVWIDRVTARRAMLDRVSSAIWFVTGLLEVAIGLRIIFLLLNANMGVGFVDFIYALTGPFVEPFSGIFNDPTFGDGSRFDTGAVLAMAMYAFLAWAVIRLLWIILDYPETGVRRSVRRTHRDRI